MFSWLRDELRRRGKFVIGVNLAIKESILKWLHDSIVGGHSSTDVTAIRAKSLFYWKGLTKDIINHVKNYGIFQQSKHNLVAYPGLLQPLPIPNQIQTHISMDFIEGLSTSVCKHVILQLLTDLANMHILWIQHTHMLLLIRRNYFWTMFKLHGLPKSITNDMDTLFLNSFLNDCFKLQGVALNKSYYYHPRSDGQTEVVNKFLEMYLRCMCSDERTYLMVQVVIFG